jgi:steroid delta-isomerase-like uncharacterized protein
MSTDENKAVIERWIQAWNAGDLESAVGLLADDYVRHDANLPEVVGPQAERQFIATVLAAFPDLHVRIDQLFAEDALVALRYTIEGTHRGEFLGVPATGRRVSVQSAETYRLSDGRLAEQWVVMDALGLFQQLGVVAG